MDQAKTAQWLKRLAKEHPELPFVDPAAVRIDTSQPLGEGAFCTAYRATMPAGDGAVREACARVILNGCSNELLKDLAVLADVSDITVPIYGYSVHRDATTDLQHVVVLSELCRHGTLEDVIRTASLPLPLAVKADVLLQVARGLDTLKRRGIVWRDLKGQNLLVRHVHPRSAGDLATPVGPGTVETADVGKVEVVPSDWGTAVKLPAEGKRRMTMHGPGTAGYIAPETRTSDYGPQADMWSFAILGMTICLPASCTRTREVEEAVDELKLEMEPVGRWHQNDRQMDAVVARFREAAHANGSGALYDLITCAQARACNPAERWSAATAVRSLEAFLAAGQVDVRTVPITPSRRATAPNVGRRVSRRTAAAMSVKGDPPKLRFPLQERRNEAQEPGEGQGRRCAGTAPKRTASKRKAKPVASNPERKKLPRRQRRPPSVLQAGGCSRSYTEETGVYAGYRPGGIIEVKMGNKWRVAEVMRRIGANHLEVFFHGDQTTFRLAKKHAEQTRVVSLR